MIKKFLLSLFVTASLAFAGGGGGPVVNDVVTLEELGFVEGTGVGSFFAEGQDGFDGATVITLVQL